MLKYSICPHVRYHIFWWVTNFSVSHKGAWAQKHWNIWNHQIRISLNSLDVWKHLEGSKDFPWFSQNDQFFQPLWVNQKRGSLIQGWHSSFRSDSPARQRGFYEMQCLMMPHPPIQFLDMENHYFKQLNHETQYSMGSICAIDQLCRSTLHSPH